MFNRPHHQKVALVLAKLNSELLKNEQCYFAGGTAIALRFGEFRESVDIDFMTSNIASYRNPWKSASTDLKKVLSKLESNPSLLEENMAKMAMDVPQAVIWQKLKRLGSI